MYLDLYIVTKPTHRLNDVRSIGRVTDVDNDVVTIEIDEHEEP